MNAHTTASQNITGKFLATNFCFIFWLLENKLDSLEKKIDASISLIKRGVEEILPLPELKEKLRRSIEKNRPLRIKAGFDPTAPDLHLGHTLLLQKLKTFQELGHEVFFLIGDYTATIGDPTGKTEMRKPLTIQEIKNNAETYQDQVFKILDPNKTQITFNSEWLRKLALSDLIHLTSKYTVARLLERDDFSKRYKNQNPISLVEFLYPILQGYDSVAMQADIELGGTDQKFNLLVGRDLQIAYRQEPQVIITLPLLVGIDGVRKMSKSLNNAIGIKEPTIEIIGKIMSISDELMWEYYNLLSNVSLEQIKEFRENIEKDISHPKELKSRLAKELAARFHNLQTADSAMQEWDRVHNPRERGLPEDIPVWQPSEKILKNGKIGILNVIRESGLTPSNSEAGRIIKSNGLRQLLKNEEKLITDTRLELTSGEFIFRIGKRKFIKVKIP